MQRHCSLVFTAAAAVALSGCGVTPTPLSDAEITQRAQLGLERIAAGQEKVDGAIDLHEAMARALKYNLDQHVEEMEAALRVKELDLAHFGLLPNVVASSGYAARNNVNASNSINVLTGAESLAVSTSQEKRISTADVTFSWNILDFGLSYVRARQAADKYLIAQEMRRKVANRIVEDVRTAYWRAVSADRLIARLKALEARVRRAQDNAHSSQADRRTSPIAAATYERELVEIKRTIQELQRDLSVARTQLAALMNITPGTAFTLAGGGGITEAAAPVLKMPVGEMIETAMQNRPELREIWYRERINDQELRAAMLELLPGLTPYVGTNFDSNDFLYNSNWVSWGAKASWNAMRLFQHPVRREVVDAQGKLLGARNLAVTMAVVTQVHVSRVRFQHLHKELHTADEYLAVQSRLLNLMRTEAEAARISEQTLIREEMNTLVAEAKRNISFANLQNAFAGVYASMGLDPYGGQIDLSADVKSLAKTLRQLWVERGERAPRRA
jgi:outer membrane protein TolC